MVLLLSIKARFRQQYIERTTTILEKELWEQDAKRMLHCWAIKNWWQNSGLFPAQFLPSVMALWAWCLLPVGKTDRLRQKRHLSMPLKRGLPERKEFIMVRWLLTAPAQLFRTSSLATTVPLKATYATEYHQTTIRPWFWRRMPWIPVLNSVFLLSQSSPQLLQSTPNTYDLFQSSASSHNDIYELARKPDL